MKLLSPFLALLFVLGGVWAEASAPDLGLPAKPTHYVTDQAGVLTEGQQHALNAQLEEVERQTSNQILVAIYPHLPDGQEMAQYATNTFESWKVGQKGKDNGVVLFIFTEDHKLFIATGQGLEGALPDAICKSIIEQEIVPRFKQSDIFGGVQAGVTAIIAASQGEYKGTGHTQADRQGQGGVGAIILFLFLLILAAIVISRGGILSALPFIISSSGGGNWSGGGGFGGGGGDGGSFSGGGGSSAGGGAGGSW